MTETEMIDDLQEVVRLEREQVLRINGELRAEMRAADMFQSKALALQDEVDGLRASLKQEKASADDAHRQLAGKIDIENLPAAKALDQLWREIILAEKPDYGDWEYPMQAYRHLKIEFDELRAELAAIKPSWDDAPEWARWLGSDEDGDWYWYKQEPTWAMGDWWDGVQWEIAAKACDMTGWLEPRPEPVE